MKHPVVVNLAHKYGKQPAHIFLRWSIQKVPRLLVETVASTNHVQGYVPLVKSVSRERVIGNTQIYDFTLDDSDMKELDSLNEDLVTDWNPVDCP